MKVKDCKDNLDIILAIEGDKLEIETEEDYDRVLEICDTLRFSQGYYGRLFEFLVWIDNVTDDYLPLVI